MDTQPSAKVRLTICGSSYVVNTSESEDYMLNLAARLNLDMTEMMNASNTVSVTTAAVMTALSYRDELEKASGSADNMRRQIKDYLEDGKTACCAAVCRSLSACSTAVPPRNDSPLPGRGVLRAAGDPGPGRGRGHAERRCSQRR